MPQEIHERNEVRRLIDRGAQVVDVLGPEEFEKDHVPGAINLSLRAEQLAGDGGGSVDAAMPPGPSTFRPNVPPRGDGRVHGRAQTW